MKKKKAAKLFAQMGTTARQKKAKARRKKVAKLKKSGMTGPQIAEALNIKIRTIYHDFSQLKKKKTRK